jgi:hypothetical protein
MYFQKQLLKIALLILSATFPLLSFETKLVKVDKGGEFGEIANVGIKGTTGVVIHNINGDFESIISYVEVVDGQKVKFLPFTTLEQDNLPYGTWKPKVGDRVLLENNYHRAIILSKNFDHFSKIRREFQKEWFHPDIYTATLNEIGHKSPLLEDFQYFCKEHSIGLVYIGFSDEVKTVDCLSMRQVGGKKLDLTQNSSVQKPFYSRIKEIDANWFGDGTEDIEDFESYYRELIER